MYGSAPHAFSRTPWTRRPGRGSEASVNGTPAQVAGPIHGDRGSKLEKCRERC
jgi:hypothetical protein